MKEIYNEGRVHGYNPYEIYVKHLLSEFPDTDIPTEKEWLATVMSDGASIIMKIAAKTKAGVHDYVLPKNSKLCGASTLLATIFDGQCNVDESGIWATAVTDYGPLASNTRQLHPETPGNNLATYPIQTTIDYHNTSKIHKQYVKLIDGLMYQPGTWEYPEGQNTGYVDDQGQPIINYPNRHPFMNFKPDLSKNGVIRLRFSSAITNDFYILIHGFSDKIALRPVFNQETGIIDNTDYEDGDYLGPLIFPWATKITFITSNEMLDMFEVPPYNRKIDREVTEKVVNAQPVIDMDSLNPISYYRDKHTDSAVPVDVTFTNPSGDYVSALTVYQREDKDVNGLNARQYPPVLYAAKVGAEGEQTMVPLDTAAPGTIKLLDTLNTALAYPKLIPNVYAIYKDDNNNLFFIDENSTESTLIDLSSSVRLEDIGKPGHPVYQAVIQSGKSVIKVPAFTDTEGNPLKKVHIAQEVEMDASVVQPNVTLSKNNYITMSNSLRLYISNTEPANDGNIPIGSIGIGW